MISKQKRPLKAGPTVNRSGGPQYLFQYGVPLAFYLQGTHAPASSRHAKHPELEQVRHSGDSSFSEQLRQSNSLVTIAILLIRSLLARE
jgi:hypothetical protein